MRKLVKHWPLWLNVLMLAGVVWGLLLLSLEATQGILTFALDDAYIHMTLARNLAQTGELSVNPGEFAFATSSPLWTVLLAGVFLLAGPATWVPLALNMLFGIVLVVVVYRLCRNRLDLSPRSTALLVASVVFVTPVPLLVFTGLEHVLQLLLAVVLLSKACEVLDAEREDLRQAVVTGIVAGALMATRYEGAFLLAPIVGFHLVRGRITSGAMIGVLGLAPVTAFGLLSLSQGGYFLPSSVILKGGATGPGFVMDLLSLGGEWAFSISGHAPDLFVILVVCAFAVLTLTGDGTDLWSTRVILPALVFSSGVLHASFVDYVFFYRYEAWVIGLGILIIGRLLAVEGAGWMRELFQTVREPLRRQAIFVAACMLVLLMLAPLAARAASGLHDTVRASRDIHLQQRQTARFLDAHYQGESVALNDIGMVGFTADVDIVDLFGLATPAVARARLNRNYGTESIRKLTTERATSIAILYDSWFGPALPSLPPEWVKVEEWRVPNARVLGSESVSIYAVDPADVETVRSKLDRFAKDMPPAVQRTRFPTRMAPTR